MSKAIKHAEAVAGNGAGNGRGGSVNDPTKLKVTRFTAKDADGAEYTWGFWRCRLTGYWFLRAYDGYVRCLAATWRDSVPRINGILANHGMTAEIS